MSIQKEVLPDQTSFQLELKTKLEQFLLKTKFFIFDIYLNHYVKFLYLLFAINIYKNAEAFFKLNAEQQKQISVLGKTTDLLKQYKIYDENDVSSFEKIKTYMDALIEQTGNISQFNKVSPEEEARLKDIQSSNQIKSNPTSGGAGEYDNINTAADTVISDIMEKHQHFHTVFRNTRNSLPQYFEMVNGLITEKIVRLQDLKNSIMVLLDRDMQLLKKTNVALSGLRNSKELALDYNINEDPAVKQNLVTRLDDITKEIEDTIEQTKKYGSQLKQETVNTSDALKQQQQQQQQQQPQQPAVSQQSAPTTPAVATGGHMRGKIRLPKNNYVNKTSKMIR
jgi:hypothetical protein